MNELDALKVWMGKRCDQRPNVAANVLDLFANYQRWSQEDRGYAQALPTFAKLLREAGFDTDVGGYVPGLALKHD